VIDPAFLLDERLDLPVRIPEHDHAHAHSHGIDSFAITFDRKLRWPAFEQAMAVLTALRGPDLLRVKGIVAVEGVKGPVVVHAVQHTAHRPIELQEWPDADRTSRLVFITRGIGRGEVENLLAAVAALAPE
jgi:G3E family GTPase